MRKGRFSVLMSVYQKESSAFLERALKSNLEAQTLFPSQFVLVCDGPLTPDLNSVIAAYAQKHPNVLKVCRLKENRGLGEALNYGVRQCDCEIIARADSDDVSMPCRFQKQIPYMERHPEIAASSAAIAEFATTPDEVLQEKHLPLTHNELLQYSRRRNPLNHMAVVFRKSDVLAVGAYQHLHFVEDYYLWIRLLAAGKKLANLPDILVAACIGNGMEARRRDKRLIASRSAVSTFMYKSKMLSLWQHWLNLTSIRVWCYLPEFVRVCIRHAALRQNGGL